MGLLYRKREKKHSKLFFFLKISKTGRRSSVRRKNSSIGNYFIKCEKGFNLQSYLHATSRAMRAEQAASTETLVQGSSRHSPSFGGGPWTFPPGAPFPSWAARWQESPQKHLQGKGGWFFFSRHYVLPEVQSVHKWSSWKTCPRLIWWILILPDSSRNALLPCFRGSSIYLKIFFLIFCFSDLKRRYCSKHFSF